MEAPSMEAAVEVEAEEEEEEATATKPRRAALTEGSSSSTGKKKKKKKRKKKQNKGSRQKASVSKILLQGEAGGLQPLQARGGVVGPLPSIAELQAQMSRRKSEAEISRRPSTFFLQRKGNIGQFGCDSGQKRRSCFYVEVLRGIAEGVATSARMTHFAQVNF